MIAVGAFAQTAVDLTKINCKGIPTGQARIQAFVPSTLIIGGIPTVITLPVCMALGAGVTLDTSNPNVPVLNVTAASAAPVPHMFMERVPIPVTLDASINTLNVSLAKLPAPGTYVTTFLRSSMAGSNQTDVALVSTTNPQQLTIGLPSYRPFTTDDLIIITYWTLQ